MGIPAYQAAGAGRSVTQLFLEPRQVARRVDPDGNQVDCDAGAFEAVDHSLVDLKPPGVGYGQVVVNRADHGDGRRWMHRGRDPENSSRNAVIGERWSADVRAR